MNAIEKALRKTTDTRSCVIADGALAGLAEMFKASFPAAAAAIVVADPRTWNAAGERTKALLAAAGVTVSRHIVEPGGALFHSEYRYAVEVREAIRTAGTPVPVAVGSGVINDLVKRASGELGVPYMVVATAASVDGYSSFGAALVTPEGAKQTYACPAPRAILADLDVLRTAPQAMAAGGYADLLAKVPAGADWILASELGAAEWHDDAWHIVQDGIPEALADADGVARMESGPLGKFVEGLMMSGFAMQAMQSSRPASGAEHMFSHILDMFHHRHRGELLSHGFQVGVFTVFMTRMYEKFLSVDWTREIDVESCVAAWREWNEAKPWVLSVFADTPFPNLGVEMSESKWQTRDELRRTLTDFRARWPKIRERLVRQLVPSAELVRKLRAVGAPAELADISITPEQVLSRIDFAMLMRNRYNLLDFLLRLGRLHAFAEEVAVTSRVWP